MRSNILINLLHIKKFHSFYNLYANRISFLKIDISMVITLAFTKLYNFSRKYFYEILIIINDFQVIKLYETFYIYSVPITFIFAGFT